SQPPHRRSFAIESLCHVPAIQVSGCLSASLGLNANDDSEDDQDYAERNHQLIHACSPSSLAAISTGFPQPWQNRQLLYSGVPSMKVQYSPQVERHAQSSSSSSVHTQFSTLGAAAGVRADATKF